MRKTRPLERSGYVHSWREPEIGTKCLLGYVSETYYEKEALVVGFRIMAVRS
jgi:hypothetical protein